MAGTKKSRKKPAGVLEETLRDALITAYKQQDDFILTYEISNEEDRIVHVMTGRLITPCMLGTLSNRCELSEQEGSRHTVLKQA